MKTAEKTQPKTIYLNEYTPPDFLIDTVYLYFDLQEKVTHVKAVLTVKRNPVSKNKSQPLILNGEAMVLKSIALNGTALKPDQYYVDVEHLTIHNVPEKFTLETEVEIKPHENTQLSGLYQSRGNYCTQCEAHGFRRITYYLDRPDVMARFTTCISADKQRYSVMLSNGNLVDEKELANGRHWVKWEDPSLKPAYLFALVAGDYDWLEDTFITQSKRPVTLRIYVEKGKLDQAQFAMEAVKRAMRWDEQKFGREYDLDIYMIVAVSDFNMGAMENKGLNIFNDRYILANAKTATDDDFIAIESVIGHEYFHNWSGNRVTVRNWFQITLKEGLTIFRDQSFTADLNSPVVKRIQDVNVIRTVQFAQDSGPLAHQIRPDSYIEVNNFYTVTVYNKGAEVIRMIQTLLGPKKFREGMDLYFSKYDGQAVTTEEFVKSFETVSGVDLTQFRRWYTQAGTPVLDVSSSYDAKARTYTLKVKQSCPPTPGQPHKENFLIPFAVGLLDKKTGKDLLNPPTSILAINKGEETFSFKNIPEPVPSLLRSFSAPVRLNYQYTDDELMFLLMRDSDGFNRWDAGQKLAVKTVFQLIDDYKHDKALVMNPKIIIAFRHLLHEKINDLSLLAQMLTLPRMSYLIELSKVAHVEAIHHVREFVKTELVRELHGEFMHAYKQYHSTQVYHFDAQTIGMRSMKNLCLAYLLQLNENSVRHLAMEQFHHADNMTDEIGALGALINTDCPERMLALQEFYQKWQKDDLVIDKWFTLQAIATLPNTLQAVKQLMHYPAFNIKNPNKVRALIGAFCRNNYINFHEKSGGGYQFLADQVLEVDPLNPQIAARLLEPLTEWHKFNKYQQNLMRAQLERIVSTKKLSKDVYEIAAKGLQ